MSPRSAVGRMGLSENLRVHSRHATNGANDVTATERPDQEEYQAILGELNEAKKNLHHLGLLDLYRSTPVEGLRGGHKTLLSYLSKGKPISDAVLDSDLIAQAKRVDVLSDALKDWTAREDEWQSQQEIAAPDPEQVAA
jgi:hypothetical protein